MPPGAEQVGQGVDVATCGGDEIENGVDALGVEGGYLLMGGGVSEIDVRGIGAQALPRRAGGIGCGGDQTAVGSMVEERHGRVEVCRGTDDHMQWGGRSTLTKPSGTTLDRAHLQPGIVGA
nr:hypothetical protein [Actinomadura rudentiformis]